MLKIESCPTCGKPVVKGNPQDKNVKEKADPFRSSGKIERCPSCGTYIEKHFGWRKLESIH